jgi:hypothetical protein
MRQNKGLLYSALILIEMLSLITIWSTAPELFMSQLAFVVVGTIIVYLLSKSDIFFCLVWKPFISSALYF